MRYINKYFHLSFLKGIFMSKLDQICESIYNDVDGAIAMAIVDLESGMPLAVYHRVAHFDQNYVDLVSAAAVDMFRGRTVQSVEEQLTKQRGKSAMHAIKEVQMITEGTFHFMITLPKHPHIVAILITTKKALMGMAWNLLRRSVDDISDNV